MHLNARYTGTLQLKQFAEHRLAEYQARPTEAAAWSAAIAYFDEQLSQIGPQIDQNRPHTYLPHQPLTKGNQ